MESIAAKSPKELTAFIEKISGSYAKKKEYDDLKREKEGADEQTLFYFQKRRGINAEKKQYKEMKEEADAYAQKKQELVR